ncbi:MAG: glycosyltransferase [Verrucomicrobiota bacterium]
MQIVVLTPVLDDWIAARELLSRLDAAFAATDDAVSVLIVDDGSSEKTPPDFAAKPYARLGDVAILRLKKNLGHQRAIAIGLCHVAEKMPCDAVLIMDGDGEDQAADAVRLADALRAETARNPATPGIIFAERTRRTESAVFRLGYFGYRVLHWLLTGRGIRFGNFSIVPRARLDGLTVEPMLWNHYAAAVVASYQPYATIPTTRGTRFAGRSRLGLVKLVVHGLSALSCYSDIIGVRLLFVSLVLLGLSVGLIIALIALRLATHVAIPGWTSLTLGLAVIFLLQVVTFASNFTLQIVTARSAQPFLPARDYPWYVGRVERCPLRP